MDDTTFAGALAQLKAGKNTADAIGEPVGTNYRFLPYLTFKTSDGAFVPWVASQTDLLANDWLVYEAL